MAHSYLKVIILHIFIGSLIYGSILFAEPYTKHTNEHHDDWVYDVVNDAYIPCKPLTDDFAPTESRQYDR